MAQDNGNWLSAEQAVMPDGTQRENLALVRKKLPALGQVTQAEHGEAVTPVSQKRDGGEITE